MNNTSQARPILNGRYELHRRIARGGMADVFLARDQLLDRPVAVKVLFAQYAAEPTFVARFRREAQAAGKLNHTNIVAVYDWGQHEDTYFIVMEYVEGRTLAEVISNDGYVNPQRAAEIAADVAAALSFAHRNGTVHRDVKPGNIMITNEGQVKVADFGIARAFGAAEDELTQTGSVMGTASYFSPEQAQGKTVDPRSDLYALGVVLFEMVSGSPPFQGDSPVAIAYKHVQEPAPRVTTRNPAVPEPIAAIIDQLLQKDPRSRYPAAEEVRIDLKNFNENRPLTGIQSSQFAGNTNATAIHNAAAATAAMPTMTDTGSTRAIIDTTRAIPATAAVNQSEAVEEYYEPPSRTGVFVVMLGVLLLVLVGLVVFITKAITDDPNQSATEESAEPVAIPDVVGDDLKRASERLENAGFGVNPTYKESPDFEPDAVISQDPAANEKKEKGTVVTLVVSKSNRQINVPIVEGLSEANAKATLEADDLNVLVKYVAHPTISAGKAINTDPERGSLINLPNDITLFVSEGSNSATIPNLTGENKQDAREALEALGFITEVIPEPSNLPKDQVTKTDPSAGSQATLDSPIKLYISEGGATNAVMPNVVNATEADAIQMLSTSGFENVAIEKKELAATDPRIGKVISQQPSAGTEISLPVTTSISITVGAAPDDTDPGSSSSSSSSTSTTADPDDGSTTTTASP